MLHEADIVALAGNQQVTLKTTSTLTSQRNPSNQLFTF